MLSISILFLPSLSSYVSWDESGILVHVFFFCGKEFCLKGAFLRDGNPPKNLSWEKFRFFFLSLTLITYKYNMTTSNKLLRKLSKKNKTTLHVQHSNTPWASPWIHVPLSPPNSPVDLVNILTVAWLIELPRPKDLQTHSMYWTHERRIPRRPMCDTMQPMQPCTFLGLTEKLLICEPNS